MGAFLCFMAVRLLAMERVLKPTGSIYLHCDHTASHYLKALMDAVFGKKNFSMRLFGAIQRWCRQALVGAKTRCLVVLRKIEGIQLQSTVSTLLRRHITTRINTV